jgi:FeS assembly SUF system regulator
MIRIGRLTDYGIVLMTYVAAHPGHTHSAHELAMGTGLPLPTVSKLLRLLVRAGLLRSHRGVKGGYDLARPATEISVAGIVHALEGPIGLTQCGVDDGRDCEYESACLARTPWQKINRAVRKTLDGIMLSEMIGPAPTIPAAPPTTTARSSMR